MTYREFLSTPDHMSAWGGFEKMLMYRAQIYMFCYTGGVISLELLERHMLSEDLIDAENALNKDNAKLVLPYARAANFLWIFFTLLTDKPIWTSLNKILKWQ